MNGENDQMSSLSMAMVRSWPARKPESTSKGIAAHSPCSSAGRPISTPPSDPAQRPPITPSSSAVSKLRSPARKLFWKIRIQTPIMIGRPNHRTRYSFCRKVRSSRNNRSLNSLDRTRAAGNSRGHAQLDQQIDQDEPRFHEVRFQAARINLWPQMSASKTVARSRTLNIPSACPPQSAMAVAPGSGEDCQRTVRSAGARVSR